MTQQYVYVFSGLGADRNVFNQIDFNGYIAVYIEWIPVAAGEAISMYAKRLMVQIPEEQPILIGLSFGGLVAIEVAHYLPYSRLILLASAKTAGEIPWYYRWPGKIGLHKLIPYRLLKKSSPLTDWFFGVRSESEKKLLASMLDGTSVSFLKWAIGQIVTWKNSVIIPGIIHIHGAADRILPSTFVRADYKIEGGGHFMTVNKPAMINNILKKILLGFVIGVLMVSCGNENKRVDQKPRLVVRDSATMVYKSDELEIRRLNDHVYQHISYLQTNTFGKVDCNGMVVVDRQEAVVFDTPATEKSSTELINFILSQLKVTVKGVVATHFHEDCLGGLPAFHTANIPSYSNDLTIELAKNAGFPVPQNGFAGQWAMPVGNRFVTLAFHGEGHTRDNIIAYSAMDSVLFGGCLIKAMGAGKGNLADADTLEWSRTIIMVRNKYPNVVTVIPGHGKSGGKELFDYTIKLFEK